MCPREESGDLPFDIGCIFPSPPVVWTVLLHPSSTAGWMHRPSSLAFIWHVVPIRWRKGGWVAQGTTLKWCQCLHGYESRRLFGLHTLIHWLLISSHLSLCWGLKVSLLSVPQKHQQPCLGGRLARLLKPGVPKVSPAPGICGLEEAAAVSSGVPEQQPVWPVWTSGQPNLSGVRS